MCCVLLFACWFFVFVTWKRHGVACVCLCAQALHVVLSGENEGLRTAWNSQARFWKKREAPPPFDVSPSSFMCFQSAGLQWPSESSGGFWKARNMIDTKHFLPSSLQAQHKPPLVSCVCMWLYPCVFHDVPLLILVHKSSIVALFLQVYSQPSAPPPSSEQPKLHGLECRSKRDNRGFLWRLKLKSPVGPHRQEFY